MVRNFKRLGISIIIIGLFGASASAAETPEDRADRLEQEIERLKAAVAELKDAQGDDDRLSEIERQLAILAEEVENLKIGEEVIEAENEIAMTGLAPAASKVYRKEQGLSIGGYGEVILEVFDDQRDDGTPTGKTDTFDLLRGVVYIGYKFDDRFVLNSEIEVEHSTTSEEGSVSVEFAYLDYLYRPGLNLRGGLVLVPMGFINELHEPTTFLGARRPETESRIIPTTWRENGFGVHGSLGGFNYRSYLVNGLDASGFSASGLRGGRQKGSKAKVESFAWVGRLDWVDTPGVLAGMSAYIGDSGQDLRAADGSSIDVATVLLEAHFEWRFRGLELRGLYARAELDDVAALNDALGYQGSESVGEEMEGFYLQAGWDLLARRRGNQALIPYLRWEKVDTQRRVPQGFERSGSTETEIFTLGLAYQPIEQIVVKVDYQDVANAAGTGVDQYNVALGYIF